MDMVNGAIWLVSGQLKDVFPVRFSSIVALGHYLAYFQCIFLVMLLVLPLSLMVRLS